MSRRADPERLYVAHRMALAARLVSDARITPESAERWIGAWEAEARVRGLDARTPEWWRPAGLGLDRAGAGTATTARAERPDGLAASAAYPLPSA